jgi:hypothetical protein
MNDDTERELQNAFSARANLIGEHDLPSAPDLASTTSATKPGRRVWLGAGLAAAAVIAVVGTAFGVSAAAGGSHSPAGPGVAPTPACTASAICGDPSPVPTTSAGGPASTANPTPSCTASSPCGTARPPATTAIVSPAPILTSVYGEATGSSTPTTTYPSTPAVIPSN